MVLFYARHFYMALPCLFYGGIVCVAERMAAPLWGISSIRGEDHILLFGDLVRLYWYKRNID